MSDVEETRIDGQTAVVNLPDLLDPNDPFENVEFASDDDDEPIPYLCEGLSLAPSRGEVSLIAGDPGSSKGPIADYIATCFALGTPLFGRYPCGAGVHTLILDSEGSKLTKRRCRRMARGLDHEPGKLEKLHVLDVSGLNMATPAFGQYLQRYIRDYEIPVVILDSYTSAMLATGADINRPEWATLARNFAALGVLVILVAHSRKLGTMQRGDRPTLGDVAGSFALSSLAQTAICVWRTEDDRDLVNVGCLRAPEKEFADFELQFGDRTSDGALTVEIRTGADAKKDEAAAEREELAMRANKVLTYMRRRSRPSTERDLRNAAEVGDKAIAKIINRLVSAKIIDPQPASRGEVYSLCGDAPEIVVCNDAGDFVPATPGENSVGPFVLDAAPRRSEAHAPHAHKITGFADVTKSTSKPKEARS